MSSLPNSDDPIDSPKEKKALPLWFWLLLVGGVVGLALYFVIKNKDAIDPQLVLVKGGSFVMGDQFGDGYARERPVHEVTLSDFYIGKYEVTVHEFAEFVKDASYKTDAEMSDTNYIVNNAGESVQQVGINWRCDEQGRPRPETDWNHPVINVSWNDATAYCDWKSRKTGKIYRLPTEAEWEYAARSGGKNYRYSWGDGSPNGNVCDETALERFSSWSAWVWSGYKDGYVFSCPVENSGMNELGLYGMTGNVWEWCQDWYDDKYYGKSPESDPCNNTENTYRVFRGGCWYFEPQLQRVTFRFYQMQRFTFGFVGFRVVRTQ